MTRTRQSKTAAHLHEPPCKSRAAQRARLNDQPTQSCTILQRNAHTRTNPAHTATLTCAHTNDMLHTNTPHQLPAVRAAHTTGIIPGLTQQSFGGEVR